MTKESFPATLDLGAIELSFTALLKLRPGMTITFARPQLFEATIKIGSEQFARAQVTLSDSHIKLIVTDLFFEKLLAQNSE